MIWCIVLVKEHFFSSSLMAFFFLLLPSNTPMMLYSICYWWFFLSQSNWWTKYLVHPKIQRPKPCLLMLASLVALDGFHLLLSTQQTSNLTQEWSGGSMFHPLSHIYAKTPFCWVETVANNTLNHWCIVVFDRLWANTVPTLNTAFSLTNVHAKWWIHCLLISSTPLPSHATSTYNWPKWVCEVKTLQPNKIVFQDNCRIWATWAFSTICVCTTIFKVSTPPLSCCFQWSQVQIILIKPLLCLNSIIFPSESNALSTNKIQIFRCFENLRE